MAKALRLTFQACMPPSRPLHEDDLLVRLDVDSKLHPLNVTVSLLGACTFLLKSMLSARTNGKTRV